MILEGTRVLDFTQYLAGPTVTRLMAEMGAEIIKIEQAPGGDPSRGLPALKDGRSGYFIQQNRGKKSLCLDLTKRESHEIIRALVQKVDVVVENFGPGVMAKRKLDYASLREINPRVIMASVSTFGRESPLSHKTGYDLIAQAFAGLMYVTGPRGGPPHPVQTGISDVSAGVHAFAALGYALFHRERTGRGQYIDISMIDVMFHMHEMNVQAPWITKGAFVPTRQGIHNALVCPCGAFRGPSGFLVILVLQRQWENLCRAMDRPDLVSDPRFTENDARARNQDALISIIETWMAGFETNEEVLNCLEQFRVPSGPVLSPTDAIGHEYFLGRGTVRSTWDPILGEVMIPGFPLRLSEQPAMPDVPAPLLGQHNRAILEQVMGYSPDRIEALASSGVLVAGDR
jgi:CoA:oxalate CoA-transferase